MKIKLDKSVVVNWPKKNTKDEVDIYQFTAGQVSVELPEEVSKYMLENYKDHMLDIIEEKEEVKPVEEIIKEVKAVSKEKTEKFEADKIAKQAKPSGITLADLAKQA